MNQGTIAALALVIAAGCGGAQTDRGYQGPVTSRDVQRGQEVFTYICAACHDGRVSPEDYDWTAAQMRRQVREGNRLMPPIPAHRVSDDDLEAVLAFLTQFGSLRAMLPAVPEESPPTGDADLADEPPPQPAAESEEGGATVEEPTAAGPDEAGPDEAGPNEAGPDDARPDEAGPDEAGPDAAGPDAAEPPQEDATSEDATPVDAAPENPNHEDAAGSPP